MPVSRWFKPIDGKVNELQTFAVGPSDFSKAIHQRTKEFTLLGSNFQKLFQKGQCALKSSGVKCASRPRGSFFLNCFTRVQSKHENSDILYWNKQL